MPTIASITAPFKRTFMRFSRRTPAPAPFPVARDWLMALTCAVFVLAASVGYAAFLLASRSGAEGADTGAAAPAPEILSRQSIENVIDAYTEKDKQFSVRAGALVTVADPSL